MTPKNTPIYDRLAFGKGQMIIKEGDTQAQAYLIQSGSVSVFKVSGNKRVELATLGSGEIIGEMALISDIVRTANVEALEDCNVILISRHDFEDRFANSDRAIQAIIKMLSQRVLESNTSVTAQIDALNDLEVAAATVYEETKAEVPNINDERLLPKLKNLLKAIEEFKNQYVFQAIERGDMDNDK